MKKVLLLALPVLAAAALFGSVTAAQATPSVGRTPRGLPRIICGTQAFSVKGLASQLKYEGFSPPTVLQSL
jgi:hypothetical protein